MKYIYLITYPNNKIYIGQDTKDLFMTYIGSADDNLIQRDFTWEEKQDLTIRKQILWYSQDANFEEVTQMEAHYILKYHSNDPQIGYNQRLPKNLTTAST